MDLDLPASTTAHGPETLADQELQSALEALHLREKEVDKLRTQLKEVRNEPSPLPGVWGSVVLCVCSVVLCWNQCPK